MSTLTIAKALNEGLRVAMEADPKVLLMGEDIGRLGGVFRVTEGLQAEFGTQRVLDTPLAESGIIGTAIGLAMGGFRPVCEIQFDGFVFPGFDQITTQLAKMTNRHEGALRMPVALFPNVAFPRVQVSIDAGDRAADQMAIEVTTPAEEAIRRVRGVRDVRSTTSRGSAEIEYGCACHHRSRARKRHSMNWPPATASRSRPRPRMTIETTSGASRRTSATRSWWRRPRTAGRANR